MVLYEEAIFSKRKLLTLKQHKWKIKLFEEGAGQFVGL